MINIYTDGAYSFTRDCGGWAFVVLNDSDKIYSESGPVHHTTNNRMEIQAALEACKWAKESGFTTITLYTDSMYVIGTMTLNWKRNKNHDLWLELEAAVQQMDITWTHVKGHSHDQYNELCDALAVNASHITN